jgi:hypothetical protein
MAMAMEVKDKISAKKIGHKTQHTLKLLEGIVKMT